VFYDDSTLFAFLAIWGLLALIFLIIAVVLYVLLSLGLYKLAVNQRIENAWLAWIPIADMYILGKLIRNLKFDSFEVRKIELVLPIGGLAVAVLGDIALIGGLLNLAYIILCLFALFKLYKMYRPEQAVLWLVLSIILPFMGPIFIFIMRNDIPVSQ
jgi:hypothetical protein